LRKAGCGNNSGNSGDDPRADAPQNDETPSLDSLALLQGKRRERWASNGHQRHAPLGGEQRDPTVRSVAALLTYKLKNGETPPDNGHHHQPESCGACSFCHGDGAVVLDVPESDPDYGKAIPCPYCG